MRSQAVPLTGDRGDHTMTRVFPKEFVAPLQYIGFAKDLASANLGTAALPFKVTFVATYKCNFRCQMCGIWKKTSTDEMTPAEVELFFERSPHFRWVHLTGGELFMRRDLEAVVEAIQRQCRSLFLLNFPTTGWFGDRTIALVEDVLRRGIGRLMVTVSLDGPPEVHEELRGVRGSWLRGIETFRALRRIRQPNFEVVLGMTLLPRNAALIDDTIAAVRDYVPDFHPAELHLNVPHESPHYFDNMGLDTGAAREQILGSVERHRRAAGSSMHPVRFIEDRYQSLLPLYYRNGKTPLPCSALAASCFVDPYWNLYPCSIWDSPVGNLRQAEFDFGRLWEDERRRTLRKQIVDHDCPHCWTPCEAYPSILSNVVRAWATADR